MFGRTLYEAMMISSKYSILCVGLWPSQSISCHSLGPTSSFWGLQHVMSSYHTSTSCSRMSHVESDFILRFSESNVTESCWIQRSCQNCKIKCKKFPEVKIELHKHVTVLHDLWYINTIYSQLQTTSGKKWTYFHLKYLVEL